MLALQPECVQRVHLHRPGHLHTNVMHLLLWLSALPLRALAVDTHVAINRDQPTCTHAYACALRPLATSIATRTSTSTCARHRFCGQLESRARENILNTWQQPQWHMHARVCKHHDGLTHVGRPHGIGYRPRCEYAHVAETSMFIDIDREITNAYASAPALEVHPSWQRTLYRRRARTRLRTRSVTNVYAFGILQWVAWDTAATSDKRAPATAATPPPIGLASHPLPAMDPTSAADHHTKPAEAPYASTTSAARWAAVIR